MQNLILVIIAILCVWYIYRKFKPAKGKSPCEACGCCRLINEEDGTK